ncbi:TPA: hypothetical protein QHB43_004606 [Aeromonas hydrophila subsp. hydrophila]|nr:hypothetical protein [Aeromonas hydrophila subsp. hydrophila]
MAKKVKPLTVAEKKWLAKLEAVLAECPSERFTSYTIGDPYVTIYDKSFAPEIDKLCDGGCDVGEAVDKVGCSLAIVRFPFAVQSTAG